MAGWRAPLESPLWPTGELHPSHHHGGRASSAQADNGEAPDGGDRRWWGRWAATGEGARAGRGANGGRASDAPGLGRAIAKREWKRGVWLWWRIKGWERRNKKKNEKEKE
jgi:hypothetical protein